MALIVGHIYYDPRTNKTILLRDFCEDSLGQRAVAFADSEKYANGWSRC
jgi:hypothetical protein